MVEQRKATRGLHGYYEVFSIPCESVPRLPASVVRCVLDDPRHLRYFLLWRWIDRGETREVLGIRRLPSSEEWVELKRPDGSLVTIRTVCRRLPRNGAMVLLLTCPCFQRPCRYLYGWSVSDERVVLRGSAGPMPGCVTVPKAPISGSAGSAATCGHYLGTHTSSPMWSTRRVMLRSESQAR